MKQLVMAVVLAASACSPTAGHLPDTPTRETPVPSGTDEDCKAAEANLCALGCEECHPTGGTFQEVCQNTEHSGYVTMNPVCLSKVKSCAETDGC